MTIIVIVAVNIKGIRIVLDNYMQIIKQFSVIVHKT